MAKKTWIKIKRGILDPKHIEKLGQAWYLYFYILDQADWDTGTIKEWKDEYAADDLQKPIGLIREHRKHLADEKYIKCEKNQHSQKITIHNWTDPRRYDNHLLNPEVESMEKDELWEGKNIQSSGQSSGQSVLTPYQNSLSSYNHITTLPHEYQDPAEILVNQFLSISGATYFPKVLKERLEWIRILTHLERIGVTPDIMAKACEGMTISHPQQILSKCTKLLQEVEA